MVFSSSATVYGQPEKIPCVEDFEIKAMNPYGRTKVFIAVPKKLFLFRFIKILKLDKPPIVRF